MTWNQCSLFALLAVAACGGGTSRPGTAPAATEPSPLAAEVVAGVDAEPLKTLLLDYHEASVRRAPVSATTQGDHRFDHLLARQDSASIDAHRRTLEALLARAREINPVSLNARDRETMSLFAGRLATTIERDVCRSHEWSISARLNPYTALSDWLGESHTVTTAADAKNLLMRLRLASRDIDDTAANLRIGLQNGRTGPAEAIRRVVAQYDAELARHVAEWGIARAATAEHADWPAEETARFRAEVLRIVESDVRPALARLREVLATEVLPKARDGKDEGLTGLRDGAACYAASVAWHLGMPRDAAEIHRLGLEQIARSDREIAAYGKKVLGTATLAATIQRLRSDKALYFGTRDEVHTTAEKAVARAKAVIPRFFGVLPKADVIVRDIPPHEAPFTTIAYYSGPHLDGTKPGEYFVNVYKPETRPRFDFEALSYHEAIPGHHLQIAIMNELGALPLFRRTHGATTFVEGWALYTERLADEMGLYSGDLDRLGMWSYDAWRSARLVVDTGIHSLGWTRAQAEQFMLEHTALAPGNVTNEVDRYIAWPGQALAYKVGQLEILALRAHAEKTLGAKFDIRAFHDTVLGGGAVTLPVLRERVNAWLVAQGAAPYVAAAR